MKNKKIKIGIIGCGWIASNAHIKAIQKNEGAILSALFDKDIKALKRLQDEYHIKKIFTEINDFLKSDIDAVIISTPNYTHKEISILCFNSKKHVLCEKPVGLNLNDVEEMLCISKKNNVVFLPAFAYRFREDIQLLCNKIIAQNCIGNMQYMHAFWIRKNGIPRPGSWYTNKKLSGGGVLVDIGSHILDICLMILKDFEYHNIQAWTWNNKETKSKGHAEWFKNDKEYNDAIDVEDNAVSKIILSNGIKLTIGVKWKSAVKNDFTYFHIQGDNGWIELKTLFGFSPDRLWPNSLISLYDKNNHLKERIKIDDNDKINSFLNLNKYFVEYINKPNKFLVNEDILNVRRLIHKIYTTKNKNSSLDNEINIILSSIIK